MGCLEPKLHMLDAALRRREKGKPAARRGRKAYGPLLEGGSRATERRWGASQEPLRK
jgi:hypothetical protein